MSTMTSVIKFRMLGLSWDKIAAKLEKRPDVAKVFAVARRQIQRSKMGENERAVAVLREALRS